MALLFYYDVLEKVKLQRTEQFSVFVLSFKNCRKHLLRKQLQSQKVVTGCLLRHPKHVVVLQPSLVIIVETDVD